MISTSETQPFRDAQQYASSIGKGPKNLRSGRAPKRKTAKLKKELNEVLASKVPFRTSLTNQGIRIKSRGRDDWKAIKPSQTLMPDRRRELHTIIRQATHCSR